MAGVRFFVEQEYAQSNYWLNALLLDRENADRRDALLDATNSQGIMTRPAWTLMHELDMYKSCPTMGALEVAQDLEQRLINIPSSANLGRP